METHQTEPIALSPHSFTHKTHIQTSIPMFINRIDDGDSKLVAPTETPGIPFNILSHVAGR